MTDKPSESSSGMYRLCLVLSSQQQFIVWRVLLILSPF